MPDSWLGRWRHRARELKQGALALSLAARDPRVPWLARALVVLVVAYAFSPIDLIPDFIPVLGYLDDLILLPLGIALAIRSIPPPIWEECQQRAREHQAAGRPSGWGAAVVIAALWALTLGLLIAMLRSPR